jgi:hypothetical protein
MVWVAVAAGIVLSIVALWKWGSRPAYHGGRTLGQLGHSIDSFLIQMAPGSTLIAHREGQTGFLQLAMRSASSNWQSVEFGLPETEWSQGHFDQVAQQLRQDGFDVDIQAGTSGQVTRFLSVSQSGDLEPLRRQLRRLFSIVHAALEWPADQRFVVHYEGGLRQASRSMPARLPGDTAV